ncbi:MAG: rhodanese-like domain-containing protein [Clostridium sp.]|uniref:rhodanese-like domain-containing protein n=1 Tax=Clostridium sp. TaxID=1506 RepID=UPI00304E369D
MFGFLTKLKGKVVNVNDMDELLGKINLIDIRETYEYKSGSLRGSKNIPMGKLSEEAEKYLNKNDEYYIMCQSGGRSSRMCSKLTKQGYNVINVSGGMGSYVGSKRK